jgi:hypothetical protein
MASSSDSRQNGLGTLAVACSPGSPATLTTTAWRPRLELSLAAWARQGRWLGALGRGSGWWIGDWVRYGNARYGDRYTSAARVTGYDVQSLMNMAYVAGRFEASRRRAGLSFSHHAEVASIPAEEQDLWLDRAEVGNLSVRSLRSELRRVRRKAASRGRREGAESGRRPMAATIDRELEPGKPSNRAPAWGRPAPGRSASGERRQTASEAGPVVVCPECGYHFTAAASREASICPRSGEGLGRTARAGLGAPLVSAPASQ